MNLRILNIFNKGQDETYLQLCTVVFIWILKGKKPKRQAVRLRTKEQLIIFAVMTSGVGADDCTGACAERYQHGSGR